MSEHEHEIDMDEFLPVSLMAEFTLRDREQTLHVPLKVNVHQDWSEQASVHDLMNIAAEMILEPIDTVGQHRLVLTDTRHSKYIVFLDEVQAILIHAPDQLPTDV